MRTIEDYILIKKIKSGDCTAWEDLVNKYYTKIFSYCVRRCLGNRILAADLTQDIFLKVIENIENYKFRGKFFNYLFTIAVNVCNNDSTKKRLIQIRFNEKEIKFNSEPTLTSIITQENKNKIQIALNKLPAIQREALILKYYHDLKVKSIAKVTGTGISTSQSRINQGLKKLRNLLDREEFMDE